MPAQFLSIYFPQHGERAHLQGLKLANFNPSDAMVVIGADIPEAFIQLHIRKGKEGQPFAIQTPLDRQFLEAAKNVIQQKLRKLLLIQKCYQVSLS